MDSTHIFSYIILAIVFGGPLIAGIIYAIYYVVAIKPSIKQKSNDSITSLDDTDDDNAWYCSRCGTCIDEVDLYCINCGCDIDEYPPTKNKPKQPTKEERIEMQFIMWFTVILIYTDNELLERIKEQPLELFPFIYIFADIAAINAGFDRITMKDIFLKASRRFIEKKIINSHDRKTLESLDTIDRWFDLRIDLYGHIIRGHKLKALCFFGDQKNIKKFKAPARCSILLSDILTDRDFFTIEEYDARPFVIQDIHESLKMQSFAVKMNDLAQKFHDDMYKILIRA